MNLTECEVKRVRDDLFRSDVHQNAIAFFRSKTPNVIKEFTNSLSMHTGGGLMQDCMLDIILVIVGFCIGRGNVRIHDNYKKAIPKLKVIIAPVSALKSPSYRLIRDVLSKLSVVLKSAVSALEANDRNNEHPVEDDAGLTVNNHQSDQARGQDVAADGRPTRPNPTPRL